MNLLLLFFGQAFNFLLIVVNIRACAKGKILVAVVTDFFICILGFGLIKLIASAQNPFEVCAYAAGGATGSAAAILLTRKWDK